MLKNFMESIIFSEVPQFLHLLISLRKKSLWRNLNNLNLSKWTICMLLKKEYSIKENLLFRKKINMNNQNITFYLKWKNLIFLYLEKSKNNQKIIDLKIMEVINNLKLIKNQKINLKIMEVIKNNLQLKNNQTIDLKIMEVIKNNLQLKNNQTIDLKIMEVIKNNLQLKNNQMFNLIDSTKLEVLINNLKSIKTQMLNHLDSMMEINPTTINWNLLENQQLIMINLYPEKIIFMKIIRKLKIT
jgi:hypothetical protein